MKSKFLFLWAMALLCVAMLLASCESVTVGWPRQVKHGPPPHAPAHGYRHKYQGLEMVYDSGRSVYVVIGLPSHYYYEGHFYRFERARWAVSTQIGGPWRSVSEESLPPGLRAKEKPKGQSKEPPGRALGTRNR